MALVLFLGGIVGVFAFRSRICRYAGMTVNRLRIGTLGVTLVFLGWYHPTQPTTQQIAILVRELISWATTGGFRWALFSRRRWSRSRSSVSPSSSRSGVAGCSVGGSARSARSRNCSTR
ncbi:hypothetical protein ACFQL0_18500 [Haloplanus litoreus]